MPCSGLAERFCGETEQLEDRRGYKCLLGGTGGAGGAGGRKSLVRRTYSKARFNSAASHRQPMTDAL